jgi:hypothetical protein
VSNFSVVVLVRLSLRLVPHGEIHEHDQLETTDSQLLVGRESDNNSVVSSALLLPKGLRLGSFCSRGIKDGKLEGAGKLRASHSLGVQFVADSLQSYQGGRRRLPNLFQEHQ